MKATGPAIRRHDCPMERVPAGEQLAQWQRNLRPGQPGMNRGSGRRPMTHGSHVPAGPLERQGAQGTDDAAFGPQGPGKAGDPAAAAARQDYVRATQKIGKLRVRAEEAMRRLTSVMPKLEHISPPNEVRQMPAAFDVGTLRRQVALLQDELDTRYRQQENLFRQNVQLWQTLEAVCGADEWRDAQREMDRMNEEIERMQSTMVQLREQLKKADSIKARLKAVKDDRKRASQRLREAEEANKEVTKAFQAVRNENEALEAEVQEQTKAIQDLQQYAEKCKELQRAEDLEELQVVAYKIYASSKSNMRRAFNLLLTAVRRSQHMRAIAARVAYTSMVITLRTCLHALWRNVQIERVTHENRAQRMRALVRRIMTAWRVYADREMLCKLACKRRLLRATWAALRTHAHDAKWTRWADQQVETRRKRALLYLVVREWKAFVGRVAAVREESMRRADLFWTRRAWCLWLTRIRQALHELRQKMDKMRVKRHHTVMSQTFQGWRRVARTQRFQRAWPLQRGMSALRSHSSLSTHVRKCSDVAEAVRRQAALSVSLDMLRVHTKQTVVRKDSLTRAYEARSSSTGPVASVLAIEALRRWGARTEVLQQLRASEQRGRRHCCRRSVRRALRFWQIYMQPRVRSKELARQSSLRRAFRRWSSRAEDAHHRTAKATRAHRATRIRIRRHLRSAFGSWRGTTERTRRESIALDQVGALRATKLLRSAYRRWTRSLVQRARDGEGRAEGERALAEAELGVAEGRLAQSRGHAQSIGGQIAALEAEVLRAQGQLDDKMRELEHRRVMKASMSETARALEKTAKQQERELEALERSRADEQGRWRKAQKRKAKQATEACAERLEELETMLDRQRGLAAAHDACQSRVADLKKRLSTAEERDERSLAEASYVAQQYEGLRNSKAAEVEQLCEERREVAERVRELEAKVQQVMAMAKADRRHTDYSARDAVRAREEIQHVTGGAEPSAQSRDDRNEIDRLLRLVVGHGDPRGVAPSNLPSTSRQPFAGATASNTNVHEPVGGSGGGGARGVMGRAESGGVDDLDLTDSLALYQDLQGAIEDLQGKIARKIHGAPTDPQSPPHTGPVHPPDHTTHTFPLHTAHTHAGGVRAVHGGSDGAGDGVHGTHDGVHSDIHSAHADRGQSTRAGVTHVYSSSATRSRVESGGSDYGGGGIRITVQASPGRAVRGRG